MKDIYEIFQFSLIKEKLKEYAMTEIAKEKINSLVMFDNANELQTSLDYLKEGIFYCYKYSRPTIRYLKNLIPELIALKKGASGTLDFFFNISSMLENISLLKEEFKESENFPLLNEKISNLKELKIVKNNIDKVVSPTLDVLDSASPKLLGIRRKLLQLENSITSLSHSLIIKYANYLSEPRGAIKNGVFTLMVKSSYKNRIPGIVHATSDTGLTVFIEPQEIIEVYNNISSLKEEEREEIFNILKNLSSFITNYYVELYDNIDNITSLDFIFAKATYGISYHGEIAKISNDKVIKLEYAAHPFIDPKKVVRNNFIIDKQKMMIITGPNAGGKTVALKVIGLLVVMHQSGLALPIKEGGELYFFKKVFADIGDNQSVLDNLSTFSSHIIAINEILKNADNSSLVIIDELGSGTSPLDGEALGLGIIDYLLEKDCFTLISSHYEGIKSYALENENILCASMIFDEKEIKPTYRLRLHVASSSYGVEVAYRLGLVNKVIERAKKYITDKKNNDKDIKLEFLNKTIADNELLKQELLDKMKELELKSHQLEQEKEKNKEIRHKILSEAEFEKQKIIEEAKEEIEQIFVNFKNLENKKLHEVIAAKRMIDEKCLNEDEEDYEDAVVKINDIVEIIASKSRGKVIRIDKNRVTIVTDSGLSIQTKLNAIRKCEIVKTKKVRNYTPDLIASMKRVSTECNVIGLTVKEAIEIISKYLDDCVSVHYKQVRIIHGSGTGRLRTGVHNYLKNSPYVESFRLGGGGEGGVGATVVTLK